MTNLRDNLNMINIKTEKSTIYMQLPLSIVTLEEQ